MSAVKGSQCNTSGRTPTFVKRMGGASRSILVDDLEGHRWIVKLNNAPQTKNSLANEMIGSHLCRQLGLPVPGNTLWSIPEHFFQDKRTWPCENYDSSTKTHFASRFLPTLIGQDMAEHLPTSLCSRVLNQRDCLGIFVFDVWAMHTDSRQALFSIEPDGVRGTFIDHGEIFGGAGWDSHYVRIDGQIVQRVACAFAEESHEVDRWVTRLQETIPKALDEAIHHLPSDWFSGDLDRLLTRLRGRLFNLEALVDEALDELRRRLACAEFWEGRNSKVQLLAPTGAASWYTI